MTKQSAGLLVFRRGGHAASACSGACSGAVGDGGAEGDGAKAGALELLLAHPGGPFFARKEFGVWTVPKGEYEEGEEAITAAEREFAEEIGLAAPSGERLDLGEVRQSSGKRVRAFAIEGDLDLSGTTSNTFEMEWPPGSGTVARFPEIDRAEWFGAEEARRRLNPSQAEFVDRLLARLGG
ncbi:MAG: NUDIX domain-containing protein [Acidimicrobiales bacterium]|jgi:predicted NUDIX family NTP pyrophosphohydrolase